MARKSESEHRTVAVAGVLLVLGWLGWSWWRGSGDIFEPGPVSAAHALIDTGCTQCHSEPFRPARQLWRGAEKHAVVANDACIRCHEADAHNNRQIDDWVPACADCHREHRPEQSLAQASNEYCIACHADLKRNDGRPSELGNVTRFETDHPEFAAVRVRASDAASLAFNHEKHLQPRGIRGNDGEQVHLSCTACHEPDSAGTRMRPIRYEQHCADCHSNSLSWTPACDGLPAAAVEAAREFGRQPLPHQESEFLRGVLRQRLTDFVQQNPEILGSSANDKSARRFPGRPRPQPVVENEWHWVNDQLANAERGLFDAAGGCRYCHKLSEARDANGPPRVAPTKIAEHWMARSQFSHRAHGTFACTECHAAAASSHTSDVLLPGIESCRRCHKSASGNNGTATTDCVECHQYHQHVVTNGRLSLNLVPAKASSAQKRSSLLAN